MTIQFHQVTKSYNGKSGCMCGCNGNYKLSTLSSIKEENAKTGWNAYDESAVSDRSVKIAINKINKALDFYDGMDPAQKRALGVDVGVDENCAWYDDGNRTTVVYF